MTDDIRAIELQRLHELEKQAALHGPNTKPETLIEIQELRTKHPDQPRNGRKHQSVMQSEFEFLANTVAASLARITMIEQHQEKADTHRDSLDTKVDALLYESGEVKRWMKAGAAMVIVILVLVFALAVRVF